jgi:hypothetical protein
MSMTGAVARIVELQARFGVRRTQAAVDPQFQGLVSDAARHAGVSPTDLVSASTAAAEEDGESASAAIAAAGDLLSPSLLSSALGSGESGADLVSSLLGGSGDDLVSSLLSGSGDDRLQVLAAFVAEQQASLGVGAAALTAEDEGSS